MYILNKKRILFLTIATLLPIGIFAIKTANNNIINNKTLATMAVPVTNKTIVIDAGHGGEDEGDCLLKLIP